MFILPSVTFENSGISLRAKVSHSWLDHEIALISTDKAVEHWKMREWSRMLTHESLRRMARDLASRMMQFSASSLVENLAPLKRLSEAERSALISRLDVLHLRMFDVAAIEQEYRTKLSSLEEAIDVFFELVSAESATESAVRDAWIAVRERGATLKELFADGRIPNGIVLP